MESGGRDPVVFGERPDRKGRSALVTQAGYGGVGLAERVFTPVACGVVRRRYKARPALLRKGVSMKRLLSTAPWTIHRAQPSIRAALRDVHWRCPVCQGDIDQSIPVNRGLFRVTHGCGRRLVLHPDAWEIYVLGHDARTIEEDMLMAQDLCVNEEACGTL